MRVIESGNGPPLVLVPGLQGRWEYMQPGVDELARSFRVITFSLCGEPTSGLALDPARGLDNYVHQITQALEKSRELLATGKITTQEFETIKRGLENS